MYFKGFKMESQSVITKIVNVSGSGSNDSEKEGDSLPVTSPSCSSGRTSPPPDCAICLGQCRNKSFTDSCLHQFCFNCLLTWSKIKAECPLCKQSFKTIIHNVKSNHQYEEYLVEQNPEDPESLLQVAAVVDYEAPRFRYRTTLTLHGREGLAIQRLLMGYHVPPMRHDALPTATIPMRRHNLTFRRMIYRQNLWACSLPDVTGRYRECSPEFYRENPAQLTRLVPWLLRELAILLPDQSYSPFVLRQIMTQLPLCPILSRAFRQFVHQYLNSYTDHFLHEFHSFASSPFDMVGYDRVADYGPRPVDSIVNEVISSSDSDNSSDSDVWVINSEAGPSNAFPAPMTLPTASTDPSISNGILGTLSNSVIAIETISHSDTDDSSDEVVMVGYIKPPHERTPEVVDLLASDSDTVIIEEPNLSPIEVIDELSPPPTQWIIQPPASPRTPPLDQPSSSGMVKLSLKRKHSLGVGVALSDSDNDTEPETNRFRRIKNKKVKNQRYYSRDSASTECTDRDTDSSDITYVVNKAKASSFSDSENENMSSENLNRKKKKGKHSQQFLASNILKRFKMSSQLQKNKNHKKTRRLSTSSEDLDTNEVNKQSSSNSSQSSCHSPRKRKSRKESKYKRLSSTKKVNINKYKSKKISKSKDGLHSDTSESHKKENCKRKTDYCDKNKYQNTKNKCLSYVYTRSNYKESPSTSKSCHRMDETFDANEPNVSHTKSDKKRGKYAYKIDNSYRSSVLSSREDTPSSSSSLLDIMNKSILNPNSQVLSINSQCSTVPDILSNGVTYNILDPMDIYPDDYINKNSTEIKPTNLRSNYYDSSE